MSFTSSSCISSFSFFFQFYYRCHLLRCYVPLDFLSFSFYYSPLFSYCFSSAPMFNFTSWSVNSFSLPRFLWLLLSALTIYYFHILVLYLLLTLYIFLRRFLQLLHFLAILLSLIFNYQQPLSGSPPPSIFSALALPYPAMPCFPAQWTAPYPSFNQATLLAVTEVQPSVSLPGWLVGWVRRTIDISSLHPRHAFLALERFETDNLLSCLSLFSSALLSQSFFFFLHDFFMLINHLPSFSSSLQPHSSPSPPWALPVRYTIGHIISERSDSENFWKSAASLPVINSGRWGYERVDGWRYKKLWCNDRGAMGMERGAPGSTETQFSRSDLCQGPRAVVPNLFQCIHTFEISSQLSHPPNTWNKKKMEKKNWNTNLTLTKPLH